MKLKAMISGLFMASALMLGSCKEKDTTVQTRVDENIRANQSAANTTVMVNDGVATISGQVESEASKAEIEKMVHDTKGVKSVVNNVTIKMPDPVVISGDSALENGVRDATKDYPTVTATVMDGVITLNGSIEKSKLPDLMMSLNSLQPKKIENKLTTK
ncbi:MAG: BON domain-containing protein [Ferruginibacter sp.]